MKIFVTGLFGNVYASEWTSRGGQKPNRFKTEQQSVGWWHGLRHPLWLNAVPSRVKAALPWNRSHPAYKMGNNMFIQLWSFTVWGRNIKDQITVTLSTVYTSEVVCTCHCNWQMMAWITHAVLGIRRNAVSELETKKRELTQTFSSWYLTLSGLCPHELSILLL